MTSSELITAAGKGDRSAFRAITERYASMVYTLCYCAEPDAERALDHTHRVFRTAFNAISLLDPGADLPGWFVSLTINECGIQAEALPEVLPENIEALAPVHRLVLGLLAACSMGSEDAAKAAGCAPSEPEQLRPYLDRWSGFAAGIQPPDRLPEQISRVLDAEEHRHDLKSLLGRFRFTIAALVIILLLFLFSRAGLLPGGSSTEAASTPEQSTAVTAEVTIPDTALVPNS